MTFSWEWALAITAGGILGIAGKFAWSLIRRLANRSGLASEDPNQTIYLSPSKAKEILHDLERKKEQTLSEIDDKYVRARASFTDYLVAQRERIIADLHRPVDPDPGDPPAKK